MTTARVRYQLLVDIDVDITFDERETIRTTKEAAIEASAETIRKVLEAVERQGAQVKSRPVDVTLPSLASAEP